MDAKRIAVSVVVPVYNTERYLERCLQSLAEQTLDDLEIIVVNDGSTDNSQDIIDRFMQRYVGKVYAIKQENQGLGPARNAGIDVASGEFIGFVDSDDWVDINMFAKLYEVAYAEKSDIVICDFTSVTEDTNDSWTSTGYRGLRPTPRNISDYMLGSMNPAFAWNKIFRRSLFNIAKFQSIWFEDVGTTPILVSHASKISYLPTPLYFYLHRSSAITSQKEDMRNLEIIQAWERCIHQVNKLYQWEVVYAIYYSIMTFIDYRPDFCAEYREFFNKYRWLFESNAIAQQGIKLEDALSEKQSVEEKLCTLETTLQKLESQNSELGNRNSELETTLQKSENQNSELEAALQNAAARSSELDKVLQESIARLDKAQSSLQSTEQLLMDIQTSFFWRLTKPFRIVIDSIRNLAR